MHNELMRRIPQGKVAEQVVRSGVSGLSGSFYSTQGEGSQGSQGGRPRDTYKAVK